MNLDTKNQITKINSQIYRIITTDGTYYNSIEYLLIFLIDVYKLTRTRTQKSFKRIQAKELILQPLSN